MNRKRCVVMLGAYPIDTTHIRGGVQAAYAYLVKGLARLDDLELHILTLRPTDYRGADQISNDNLTIHFLPNYPRFERLRGYHTYQTTINQNLAKIHPDLIHAQDAGSDALVAIRSGFPAVITVHGIRWEDGKYYRSLANRVRVSYDSFVTERYVVRNARHLIAISPYVARYFKDMLRPDVKVYSVPNAIDAGFFEPGQFPDQPVVLFAGRVITRKGVMDLVQAFAQVAGKIPSARLHIAGETSTEPAYVAAIQKWMYEARIQDKVCFLGALSEESVLQEFAGCSLLALPSSQETAPMVIAQAMAAGKPVVATRVGGVEDMVGEDSCRGLLVNVGDVNGLAAAITRLLQDPVMQAEIGRNARLFAQENYDIERVARRTADVYHRIAAKEQKTVD